MNKGLKLKSFALILTSLLMMLAIAPSAYAASVARSSQTVYVNGVKQSFDAYNIDGNNYFKLRDIAYVLSNTGSQFSVSYDSAAQMISVKTKTAYNATGNEMTIGTDMSKTAVTSNQGLKVNESPVSLTSYNIGGSNYYKLRDLGSTLGFEVSYNETAKSIIIKSSGYNGSDVKDGTRNNPYSFGDKIEINFVGSNPSNFGKLYFTAIDYLNPSEMASNFNDSHFEQDPTGYYIYANVELANYSSKDTECKFTDAIASSYVVSSNLVNCNYYSWYTNPSTYQFFSLYSGGKSACYIPVETKEIAKGETAKYFVIKYYADNKRTEKTVWIAMP